MRHTFHHHVQFENIKQAKKQQHCCIFPSSSILGTCSTKDNLTLWKFFIKRNRNISNVSIGQIETASIVFVNHGEDQLQDDWLISSFASTICWASLNICFYLVYWSIYWLIDLFILLFAWTICQLPCHWIFVLSCILYWSHYLNISWFIHFIIYLKNLPVAMSLDICFIIFPPTLLVAWCTYPRPIFFASIASNIRWRIFTASKLLLVTKTILVKSVCSNFKNISCQKILALDCFISCDISVFYKQNLS